VIAIDFSGVDLKLKPSETEGKALVFDPVRKKWLVLTPEEHVRQYLLHYFINTALYPPGLMAVERKIMNGKMAKRFDIVVYQRNHVPWMLVECKSPDVLITESTLQQLLQYQKTIQCRYWVLTNGHQTFCADAANIHDIRWIAELPFYNV
jgi:hypothetical protein